MATTQVDGDDYFSRGPTIYTTKQVRFYFVTCFLLVCMSGFYFILDFYFKFYTPKGMEYGDTCGLKLMMKLALLLILVPFTSFTFKRMKIDVMLIFLHTFFFLLGSILLVMSM